MNNPCTRRLVTVVTREARAVKLRYYTVNDCWDVQEDAVAYALDHLEERTWAVIALDEADGGKVDYTIRMNFTVLPNTNEIVDMIAIGLDPR